MNLWGIIVSTITSEKELGQALKSKRDTIEIEGDLSKKVIKIKATGAVAWVVAIGAIGIAVAATFAAPATAGTSGVLSVVGAGAAVSVLGLSTTTAAISIAVAAGGVGALNTLRSYKIEKKTPNKIILRRK